MSFTASTKGGEYQHTLTVSEMPKHTPKYKLAYGGADPARGFAYGNSLSGVFEGDFIQQSGDSQSHNNISPYETVCYWTRIS